MNRFIFLASIALFAIGAAGCTRDKPPSAQDKTIQPKPTALSINGAAALTIQPTATLSTPAGFSPDAVVTIASPTDTPVSPTLTSSATFTPTILFPPSVLRPPSARTPLSGSPTTYTIQWGDGLDKIARQFGLSSEAIVAANPGINPNLLVPGQVLNIPPAGGTDPTPAPGATLGSGPTTYTVQRGDWFYAIARKFGVSTEALQAANPGVNPNIVYAGQALNIPGAGAITPPSPTATRTLTTGVGTTIPSLAPSDTGKPSRYTVQPGDTLFAIAARFGTTPYALQIANHLPNQNFIFPGQILIIPN